MLPQGKFKKGEPMLIACPVSQQGMWASRAGVFPGPLSKEDPGPLAWLGVEWWTVDKPETQEAPPVPLGLFAKRQSPGTESIWGIKPFVDLLEPDLRSLLGGRHGSEKSMKEPDFSLQKGKNSKWPNGTVPLASRVASLVLSVLKPGYSWANPAVGYPGTH